MTFASMESSDAVPEAEHDEVQEQETVKRVEEARPLEQASFEPEEKVALEGSYQEAEAVENAFTEVMQVAEAPVKDDLGRKTGAGEPAAIIDSNDGPRSAAERVSATPIPLPKPGEDVSATPIPLPKPEEGPRTVDETVDSSPGRHPGGGVEATPINVPNPQDEVSATPITLPGQAREGVESLPVPIPDPRGEVSIIDSKDRPRTIDKTTDTGPGGRPGGGVEATPINLPNPVEESSSLPLPIPDLRGEEPVIDSSDRPGPGNEEVMIDTVPLPEKPEMVSPGTAMDEVAIGTWPTPEKPVNDRPRVGDERVMIDTVPLPERPEMVSPGTAMDEVAIGTWPTPDKPVDEFFDPHAMDQMDPGLNDARMEDLGYLGEAAPLHDGMIPEAGADDPMGDIGDIFNQKPDEVEDPFETGPQWGETKDGRSLTETAGPGGDPQVGIGVVKYVTGKIWGAITKDSGTDKGSTGGTAPRGTPDPESGGSIELPEIVVGDRVLGQSPGETLNPSGKPLDYAQSMMQPVGEDPYGTDKPRPMDLNTSLDSNLDPYINWGDDSDDGLADMTSVVDPQDFDPDSTLIDPPDMINGEGDGKEPPK